MSVTLKTKVLRRLAHVGVFVMLLAFAAHNVWAFSVTTASKSSKNLKRYSQNKVYYFLHPDGSDDLPKATTLKILRDGFQGWMDVECGDLTFTEGYHCNTALGTCLYDSGKSCKADTDCPAAYNKKLMPLGYKNNKRNEMVFAEDSSWNFGTYVLGVTVALNSYSGAIVESDIVFNGYQQKWVTDAYKMGNGNMHLLSVAIHEQGHFFGVMHNLGGWASNNPPTMAPNVQPYGWSASLNFDDEKAICFLNPKGGKYSCKNDDDCPYVVHKTNGKEAYSAKYSCQSGSCVWGSTSGGGGTSGKKLGDPCTSSTQCPSPLFCQPVGGQAYCSQACNPQQKNCPTGFTCFGYQNQPTKGACLKTPGSETKKKLGETCAQSIECASLLCLQGSCQTPCTPGGTTKCPSGQQCQTIPGGGGVCVKPTGPILKGVGEDCQDPAECASGVCMKADLSSTTGQCRDKCTGPGDCPLGFKCVSQGEGYQGCLPGKESIPSGGLCNFDEQCAGGKCILAGDDGKVCSQSCTVGDAQGCPCGMLCQNTANGGACFPAKPIGCLPGGVPCKDDSECASSVCADGQCRQACDIVYGTDKCAQGEGCLRVAPDTTDGYCTAKGMVAPGNFCLGDELCVTLFCESDITKNNEPRCGKPCDPGGSTCAAGDKCNPISDKVGVCYTPTSNPPDEDKTDVGSVAPSDAGSLVLKPIAVGDGDSSSGCNASHRATHSNAPWLLLVALSLVWVRRRVSLEQP